MSVLACLLACMAAFIASQASCLRNIAPLHLAAAPTPATPPSQPSTAEQPLEMETNPQGEELRMLPQVFNAGDGRCKVVTLALLEVATRSKGASVSADMLPGGGFEGREFVDGRAATTTERLRERPTPAAAAGGVS